MSTPSSTLSKGTILALKGPSLFVDKDSNSSYPPPPAPNCTHPPRPRLEALLANDGPVHSSVPWELHIDEEIAVGEGAITQMYAASVARKGGSEGFDVLFVLSQPSLLPNWTTNEYVAHSTTPSMLLEKDMGYYSTYRALQGFELPHVYGMYRFTVPGEKYQCVGMITEDYTGLLKNPCDFNIPQSVTAKIEWELDYLELCLSPETFAAFNQAYSRFQKRYLACDPNSLPFCSFPAILDTSTAEDIHFIVVQPPRTTRAIEDVRAMVRETLRDNQCVTGHEVRTRRRLYEDSFFELAFYVQLGRKGEDIIEGWSKGEWVKSKYGVNW
ncbi:hypothetical protein JCM5353_001051 [Sporobolomyces roseus]